MRLRVEYVYDVFGNRVAQTVDTFDSAGDPLDSETSRYAFIGQQVWADLDENGDIVTRYLLGDNFGERFARSGDGDTFWLLTDRLGSTREILDETGEIVDEITYDAFGNITSETDPGVGGDYLYTGLRWFAATALYGTPNRDYDPTIAKWLQVDPISFNGGLMNLYGYVGNNGTNLTDLSGLQSPPHLGYAPNSYGTPIPFDLSDPGSSAFMGSMTRHNGVNWQARFRDNRIAFGSAIVAPPTNIALLAWDLMPWNVYRTANDPYHLPNNPDWRAHVTGEKTYGQTMFGMGWDATLAAGMVAPTVFRLSVLRHPYTFETAPTAFQRPWAVPAANSAYGFSLYVESLRAEQIACGSAAYPARNLNIYIPTRSGAPIPLREHRVDGPDIPLPDPAAMGRPHTVLGSRIGSDGILYRQSATFVDNYPSANGFPIPTGRIDWHNHSRPWDHPQVHMHLFNTDNPQGVLRETRTVPIVLSDGSVREISYRWQLTYPDYPAYGLNW